MPQITMPPQQKYPDIPAASPLATFSKGQFYSAVGTMFELMVAAAITGETQKLIPSTSSDNYTAQQKAAISIYNKIVSAVIPKDDPTYTFFQQYLTRMKTTALSIGRQIAVEQKDALEKLFGKNFIYSEAAVQQLLGAGGTNKLGDIHIEPHSYELKYYSSPSIQYIGGSVLNLFPATEGTFEHYVRYARNPNQYWSVNSKSPQGDIHWAEVLSTGGVVGYFNKKVLPNYRPAGKAFKELLYKGGGGFSGPKTLVVGWSTNRHSTHTTINLNAIAESLVNTQVSIKNLSSGISFIHHNASIGSVSAASSFAAGLRKVAATNSSNAAFPALEVSGYLNLNANLFTN